MKIKTEQVIEVQDWDELVKEIYKRPYNFQQQDGCKNRGNFYFKVPSKSYDFKNESIPEIVNNETMGVSFESWLKRDPKQPLKDSDFINDSWEIDLWWERNFYPDFQMIANDLHKKGLLKAGYYTINIDW